MRPLRGKLVRSNYDDDDNDGVSDGADGWNSDGVPSTADDVTAGESFVPVILRVNPAGLKDLADARVKIQIPHNNPTGGVIRLWRKPGHEPRIAQSLLGGAGDWVTPGDYSLAQLGLPVTEKGGEVTLWAEGLRESSSAGDIPITAKLLNTCVKEDAVKLTTYRSQWATLKRETSGELTATAVSAPPVSNPAPLLTLNQNWITSTEFSQDKTKILANVSLTGTVSDAACDRIAGVAGKITQLNVFLNGKLLRNTQNQPVLIPVTGTKAQEHSGDVLKPYPFAGAYSAQLQVEVAPGWNQIRLEAVNPYEINGYVEGSVEVIVDAPTSLLRAIALQIDTQGHDLFNPVDPLAEIVVTFTRTGGALAAYQETLTLQYGAASGLWEFNGTLLQFAYDTVSSITSVEVRTHTDLYFVNQEFVLSPDPALATGWNGSKSQEVEHYELTSFNEWTTEPGDSMAPVRSGPGEDQPFVFMFKGPATLVESGTRVTFGVTEYRFLPIEIDGVEQMCLAPPTADYVSVFTAIAEYEEEIEDLAGEWPETTGGNNGILAFIKGFGRGVLDGTVISMYDGVVSVLKFGWRVSPAYHAYRWYQDGTLSVVLEEDREAIRGVVNTAEIVARTLYHLRSAGISGIEQILTGQSLDFEKLSPREQEALQLVATILRELWTELEGWWDQADDYDVGRLIGRIVGEVTVAVVTIPASGGTAAAAKGAQLTSVVSKLRTASAFSRLRGIAGVEAKLAEGGALLSRAAELTTTKMCFVAGTLVMTATGPVPIESIRQGELVLSRDEVTSEMCYQPVINTIVTHPDNLFTLQYSRGMQSSGSITGTGEHPFYVPDEARFVRMDRLLPGSMLLLANGGNAWVDQVIPEVSRTAGSSDASAGGGVRYTTYNLEVAEFHTYFVGHHGIWVHNASELCARAAEVWRWISTEGADDIRAFDSLMEMFPNLPDKEIGDIVDTLIRDMISGLDPSKPFWTDGGFGDGVLNLVDHWRRRKAEGRLTWIRNELEYAAEAIRLAQTPSSAVSSLVKVGWRVDGRTGMWEKVVLDMRPSPNGTPKRALAIKVVEGPNAGQVKTLFEVYPQLDPYAKFAKETSTLIKPAAAID